MDLAARRVPRHRVFSILGAYQTARRRREALSGILFATPWMAGLLLFFAGPFIYSIALSFTDFKIGYPVSFHRIGNYVEMFTEDDRFRIAFGNTAYYVVLSVPLGITVSLGLAVLMNQGLRGTPVFRTMVFVPSIVAGVAVALLWMYILDPNIGLVNYLLSGVGIRGPLWLQSETWAKPALIVISLSGAGGSTMVVFLAGLQNIPQELYEAAEMDGAPAIRKFWSITLPMISPVTLFNVITGIIGAFQVFTAAYVVTSGYGGPHNATLFYALYLYNVAFWWGRLGYGSALAWVLFLIILFFTIVQLRLSNRWVFYAAG